MRKTWLIRLYPRSWRQRYEDEFVALLEQRRLCWRDLLDIVLGALDAHLFPQVCTAQQHARSILFMDENIARLMERFHLSSASPKLEKPKFPPATTSMDQLPREQAQNLLGFALKVPGYLPDGYPAPNTFAVTSGYLPSSGEPFQVSGWRVFRFNRPWSPANQERIRLDQTPISVAGQVREQMYGGPWGLGEADVQAVTVAGAPGLWFQVPAAMHKHGDEVSVVSYKHVLLWEQDGVEHKLEVALELPLSEALKVAESLG